MQLVKRNLLFIFTIFTSTLFAQQSTVTFGLTGSPENWIVPACVQSIDLIVAGGQGGGNQIQPGTGAGGQGAVITTTVAVNPGDVITVIVGGEGDCGNNSGGFNGGGTGWAVASNNNYSSCGGGGATIVQINGVQYLIAAGGGGSGGGSTTVNGGGNGGCAQGSNGGNTFGQGGGGGSQVSGGFTGAPWAGTVGTPPGQPGALGQGGAGGFWNTAPSGGGGGGYYGGGAGGVDGCCTGANGGGGGGGGSSLVPAGAGCVAGSNTGDGYVTINYIGGIVASAANTGPYCEGDDIVLSTPVGTSWAWTGPNGFTSTLQNPIITGATLPMDGVYQVIISDVNCPIPDTAWTTVIVNEVPIADPITDQIICHGQSSQAVNLTGSMAGATYSWTNNNTTTGLAANGTGSVPSFVGNAIGNTEISTITITPSTASCTGDPITFSITVHPTPTVSVSNDTTVCQNGTANLVAVGASGGGGPYIYHWDFTPNTGPTQDVNPISQTIYSVYVENQLGCVSTTEMITVDVHPPLSGTITPWDTICPGYPTTITATANGGIGAPYTFTWSSGETNTGNGMHTITANPPATQDYIVTITDECETTPLVLQTNIYVAPLPVPDYFVVDPIQCEPAEFTIINTTDPALSEYVYWLIGDQQVFVNQDTILTDSLWAGYYDIQMIVTTDLGCVDSLTFEDALHVKPQPIADFKYSPSPVLMYNTDVFFQNYSVNGYTYQWFFPGAEPSNSTLTDVTVVYPEGVTGTYDVMLITTSELGCIDTAIQQVVVVPEVLIFAPNAFTPDGDEYNQGWRVYMEGVDLQDFELLIYNRWGEIVWESHDIEVEWDGTFNGKLVKSDTYTWVIQTKDAFNDSKYTYNGHVTIIR